MSDIPTGTSSEERTVLNTDDWWNLPAASFPQPSESAHTHGELVYIEEVDFATPYPDQDILASWSVTTQGIEVPSSQPLAATDDDPMSMEEGDSVEPPIDLTALSGEDIDGQEILSPLDRIRREMFSLTETEPESFPAFATTLTDLIAKMEEFQRQRDEDIPLDEFSDAIRMQHAVRALVEICERGTSSDEPLVESDGRNTKNLCRKLNRHCKNRLYWSENLTRSLQKHVKEALKEALDGPPKRNSRRSSKITKGSAPKKTRKKVAHS